MGCCGASIDARYCYETAAMTFCGNTPWTTVLTRSVPFNRLLHIRESQLGELFALPIRRNHRCCCGCTRWRSSWLRFWTSQRLGSCSSAHRSRRWRRCSLGTLGRSGSALARRRYDSGIHAIASLRKPPRLSRPLNPAVLPFADKVQTASNRVRWRRCRWHAAMALVARLLGLAPALLFLRVCLACIEGAICCDPSSLKRSCFCKTEIVLLLRQPLPSAPGRLHNVPFAAFRRLSGFSPLGGSLCLFPSAFRFRSI